MHFGALHSKRAYFRARAPVFEILNFRFNSSQKSALTLDPLENPPNEKASNEYRADREGVIGGERDTRRFFYSLACYYQKEKAKYV